MQLKEYINYPLAELAGRDSVPCVEMREAYVYKDKERTDVRDGMTYGILLPSQNFQVLRVKVAAEDPSLTPEYLDECNKELDPVMVSFKGLQIKPYSINGQMQISAKAESITVLGQLSQIKEG